jgi:3-dehydroquinate synthase
MRLPHVYTISIDVGGTKTKASILDQNLKVCGTLLSSINLQDLPQGLSFNHKKNYIEFLTPTIFSHPECSVAKLQEVLILGIVGLYREICLYNPNLIIKSGTIAFAGKVDKHGLITKAADIWGDWGTWDEANVETQNHIGSIETFDLANVLRNKTSIPWNIENDVIAASHRYENNEGTNGKNTVLLTISTGIGYVKIDKSLVNNDVVSIGHYKVDSAEKYLVCSCGGHDHFWSYTSGKGIQLYLEEFLKHSTELKTISNKLTNSKDVTKTFFELLNMKNRCAILFFNKHFLANYLKLFCLILNDSKAKKIVIVGSVGLALVKYLKQLDYNQLTDTHQKDAYIKCIKFIRTGNTDQLDGVVGSAIAQTAEHKTEGEFHVKTKRVLTSHQVDVSNIFSTKNNWLDKCLHRKERIKRTLILVDSLLPTKTQESIAKYFDHTKLNFKIIFIDKLNQKLIENIYNSSIQIGLSRKDCIIIIGDQNLLDRIGYLASRFRRGIGIIHINIPIKTNQRERRFKDKLGFLNSSYKCIPDYTICDSMLLANTNIQNKNVVKTYKANYTVQEVRNIFNLKNTSLKLSVVDYSNPFILVDNNFYNIYGKHVEHYFIKHFSKFKIVKFNSNENNKTLDNLFKLGAELSDCDVILAIGGGIVMDIAGFLAALVQKEYVRVPTTLMGVVDAGVGIKVGVNFGNKKNNIGGFYPPMMSLYDRNLLSSLSVKDLRMGISEMLKIGIMTSGRLFSIIESNFKCLLESKFQDDKISQESIYLSIRLMLEELEPNIFEYKSLKRLVDFGHSFSSAIEAKSNFQIAHGDAVAIDMAISTQIAYQRDICSSVTRDKVIRLIKLIGLPIYDDLCEDLKIFDSLEQVKLHRGGRLNFPVPKEVGQGIFINSITLKNYKDALIYLKKLAS